MKQAEDQLRSLEWAKSISRDQLAEVVGLAQRMGADPIGFLDEYVQQVGQQPQHAQALRSYYARQLAALRGQGSEEAEPEPDLVADNGRPVYSADQLRKWQTWNERRLEQKFTEQLQPFNQFMTQSQQTAAYQQQEQRAWHETGSFLEQMRQQPHFKELEKDIRAFVSSDESKGMHWQAAVMAGYARGLQSRMASAQQQGRAGAVADLKSRAVAQTLNPAQAGPASPTRFDSFEKALQHFGAGSAG